MVNDAERSTGRGVAGIDAGVLALQALAHVAGDADLGPRFLSLSGIDVETLRARAGDPALLAAVIEFLCARESDLVACAEAIGVRPASLAGAGAALSGDRM